MNMTEKLKFVLGRVENIVGKGENAGNQHFYAPVSKDLEHIVLPWSISPSVCPSVCLHKINMKI